MKKIIILLGMAVCLFANVSAQSVYDMKKKDMITIINGTDRVLVPIELFEKYGSKCLEAYYNGSVEIYKKDNYSFSRWGFDVEIFEQTDLLVRSKNNCTIEEESPVKVVYSGLSVFVLLYILVLVFNFFLFRTTDPNIVFWSSCAIFGAIGSYFIIRDVWFGLALYIGLFFVGAGIGYLLRIIKTKK
ncbi:MAG: hypothetical protein WCH65_07905 [bacterium]